MISYSPTAVTELVLQQTIDRKVILKIKREDMNHPTISGNKWWKLKYNIEQARKEGHDTVLTFGGAYSNHIFATAAYAKEQGLKSVGIIRGEKILPLNNTLKFAEQQSMKLHFVDREQFRNKHDQVFLQHLHDTFGNFYLIPEGGTNDFAIRGCAEFASMYLKDLDFDYVVLPVGTGGTMAGLICGLADERKVIGIPVLKGGEFLFNDIATLVKNFSGKEYGNWTLLTSYHQGGYAKVTDELQRFIVSMFEEHNLPLDQVYTGKMLFAVLKEIEAGKFEPGSTILVLHTGGLQGSFMRQALQ